MEEEAERPQSRIERQCCLGSAAGVGCDVVYACLEVNKKPQTSKMAMHISISQSLSLCLLKWPLGTAASKKLADNEPKSARRWLEPFSVR